MAVLLLTNFNSFLSLEVRSCDIVHVTAVEAKDCLRATDHVPTGSVTQRSITLAYGLHLPHSRTNTSTSRKAEHEQRVKAQNFRLQTSDFRDIYLNRIAEKVNQYLSGCVPVDEKYGT